MYCPSCGTQNDDAYKFCKKCGTTLPTPQAQQPFIPPKMVPNPVKGNIQPTDQADSSKLLGGIASMLSGALVILGWFLPWSKDFLSTTSGFDLTISGFTSILSGFALLTNENSAGFGLLILLYSIVIVVVYGLLPIWGWMTIKDGYQLFEKKSLPKDVAKNTLTTVEFRSRRGFILVAIIFILPLIFSAVLKSASPLLYYLGQLAGKLLQSQTGLGIFVTATGFILSYVGARYAGTQLGQVIIEEGEKLRASIRQAPRVEELHPLDETENQSSMD